MVLVLKKIKGLILKNLQGLVGDGLNYTTGQEGPKACFPENFLKVYDTVMVILGLFEQF